MQWKTADPLQHIGCYLGQSVTEMERRPLLLHARRRIPAVVKLAPLLFSTRSTPLPFSGCRKR